MDIVMEVLKKRLTNKDDFNAFRMSGLLKALIDASNTEFCIYSI